MQIRLFRSEGSGHILHQVRQCENKQFPHRQTVYNHITDATTDVWIPIHMNHVTVNEGYRIWHGEPFKEGYLQAPPSTDHFDLHSQGPTTDTKYKALELIPGLNVGGYFDAGDFDIETGANINVVQNLSEPGSSSSRYATKHSSAKNNAT